MGASTVSSSSPSATNPRGAPDRGYGRVGIRLAQVLEWWLPPAAIVILTWATIGSQPQPGIDAGWMASLQMAIHSHLAFGRGAVFTYGPLGFLDEPQLWHLHLAQMGFIYAVILRFGLAAGMYHSARKLFGRLIAFVVAGAVMSIALGGGEAELPIALIVAAWALRGNLHGYRAGGVAAIGGAFAGFALLTKVSVGFFLLLMVFVLALSFARGRRRNLILAAAAFVVSLLAFWLISGQPLAALPDYVDRSIQISAGYAPAMSSEQIGLGWQFTGALLILAIGTWAGVISSVGWDASRRWGLVVLWWVFWFAVFKEGFVRHDEAHGLGFFVAGTIGFFAFLWGMPRRNRLTTLGGLGLLVALCLAAQSVSLTTDLQPGPSVSSFFTQVGDYFNTRTADRIQLAGREAIQITEPLQTPTIELLVGHTAAVYPIAQEQAWAYNVEWDPLPVFQSYVAYTSGLDALDAAFLGSRHAPSRILFEGTTSIDGRVGAFDESETVRAMLCRYRLVDAIGSDAILARSADRCGGRTRLVQVVKARWGETVKVPRPPSGGGYLVLARIDGTAATGLEALKSFFLRPTARYVSLNGKGLQRFVTGTATDGLVLRASTGTDYPAPFAIAAGARTISVSRGLGRQSGGDLTYRFYVEPIARVTAPGPPPRGSRSAAGHRRPERD